MPEVIWEAQNGRTPEEQRDAEWRIAKHHLGKKPPGTQLNPRHGQHKVTLRDPQTGDDVTLTHRYLKGADDNIFVKSNGKILGRGSFGKVTLGQTEDGRMWAIKETLQPDHFNETAISFDLGVAAKPFKDKSKYYQVYKFLGTSLDKYLEQNSLSVDQQYDLAIKIAKTVHHLHAGTYSTSKTKYAHLDIKPENFCIDDEGNIHLIDYGFTQKLHTRLHKIPGTRAYISSDYFRSTKEQKDVFAMLRTLFISSDTLHASFFRHKHGAYVKNSTCVFSSRTINPELFKVLDTKNATTSENKAIDVCVKIILIRHGMYTQSNLIKSIDDPIKFDINYQRLQEIGLDHKLFIQMVLDTPDLIDQLERHKNKFERHKNKFLKLHQLGFDQKDYIQIVLDRPDEYIKNIASIILNESQCNGSIETLEGNEKLQKAIIVAYESGVEINTSTIDFLNENVSVKDTLTQSYDRIESMDTSSKSKLAFQKEARSHRNELVEHIIKDSVKHPESDATKSGAYGQLTRLNNLVDKANDKKLTKEDVKNFRDNSCKKSPWWKTALKVTAAAITVVAGAALIAASFGTAAPIIGGVGVAGTAGLATGGGGLVGAGTVGDASLLFKSHEEKVVAKVANAAGKTLE
ncbi:hypothetical protein L3V83_10005 [Thiotrichales bacterium 19X7-9]|nr:hypothetical protein [Thiotrichales bacterium 19X7-9]